MSFVLIIIGAILFFFTEIHKLKDGYSISTLIFNSIFYSISTRTAGFNYLDNSLISGRTQIVSLPFMFIGRGHPDQLRGELRLQHFF